MNEKITYCLLKVQSFYKHQLIYSIDIPGWKQWLPVITLRTKCKKLRSITWLRMKFLFHIPSCLLNQHNFFGNASWDFYIFIKCNLACSLLIPQESLINFIAKICLKVWIRNESPESAWQLLIATQRAEQNRFHSSLISVFWNNFQVGCQQRQPSACARGGCFFLKIIKAACTAHVVSWWICNQYLHMIYWCPGDHGITCGLPVISKLATFICGRGHYCSLRGGRRPTSWERLSTPGLSFQSFIILSSSAPFMLNSKGESRFQSKVDCSEEKGCEPSLCA